MGNSIVISDEEDQVRSVEYEDHAQKDIARNLNSGISSDILSNNGFLALSRQDFRTLTGKNHINDKIIDEYLHLIQRRSQLPGNKKVVVLPCHAYSWLEENFDRNFGIVVGWLKEDVRTADVVFAPINAREHWSLITFYPSDNRIIYTDSIIGSRRSSKAPKIMSRFFSRLYENHYERPINISSKIDHQASVQANSYDCGIFLCANAELMSRELVARPKQEDMTRFRSQMIADLLKGSLGQGTADSGRLTAVKEKPKEKVIEKDSRKVIFGNTKQKEGKDSRKVIFGNTKHKEEKKKKKKPQTSFFRKKKKKKKKKS